jgi:hypothetical protein
MSGEESFGCEEHFLLDHKKIARCDFWVVEKLYGSKWMPLWLDLRVCREDAEASIDSRLRAMKYCPMPPLRVKPF